MKTARFVLRIVGASLAFFGTVCLILGFWDKLIHSFSYNNDN